VLKSGNSFPNEAELGEGKYFYVKVSDMNLPENRVASASVRDGISAAAVVFAPDYGSEDDHQIRPHIFSRDCAGSTSPDSLAPAA
jgi:hypothetical protein